jgi:hypothetical protein
MTSSADTATCHILIKCKRSSKLRSLLATSRGTGSVWDIILTFPEQIFTKLASIANEIILE